MKSDCDHAWILNVKPNVCLWCGIRKTRSRAPVPKLKIPVIPADRPRQRVRKPR